MNNIKLQPINLKENAEEIGDEGDRVDVIPEDASFTCLDFFGGILGIFFFCCDVFTDIGLMWFYFESENYIYFGLTSTFVIIPALVTNILSIKWYCADTKKKDIPQTSTQIWIYRIIFHLLAMGVPWRTIESLMFGCKSLRSSNSQSREVYYAYSVYLDADTSLLKLIETFLEAAPQFTLQLYILIKEAQIIREHIENEFQFFRDPCTENQQSSKGPKVADSDDTFPLESSTAQVILQVLSISSALTSLSLALTLYARNNRISQKDEKNMSIIGSVIYFCWHFLSVGSRVLALSLFASVFTVWFFVVIVIRWMFMTAWIIIQQPKLISKNECIQHCFEPIFGLVYLFTYINLKNGPSGKNRLFYYSYEIIEDSILVALWARIVDPSTTYFYSYALVSHFGGAFFGLTCMFLYYLRFHPRGPKKNIDTTMLIALLRPKTDDTKVNGIVKVDGNLKKFQRSSMTITDI